MQTPKRTKFCVKTKFMEASRDQEMKMKQNSRHRGRFGCGKRYEKFKQLTKPRESKAVLRNSFLTPFQFGLATEIFWPIWDFGKTFRKCFGFMFQNIKNRDIY